MLLVKRIIWLIYMALYCAVAFYRLYAFTSPYGNAHFYYSLVTTLEPSFYIQYALALTQITIELLFIPAIFFYAYKLRPFSQGLFQFLLLVKIALDLFGHPYETIHIVSIFHYNLRVGLFLTSQLFLFYLPAYLAGYRLAFTEKLTS